MRSIQRPTCQRLDATATHKTRIITSVLPGIPRFPNSKKSILYWATASNATACESARSLTHRGLLAAVGASSWDFIYKGVVAWEPPSIWSLSTTLSYNHDSRLDISTTRCLANTMNPRDYSNMAANSSHSSYEDVRPSPSYLSLIRSVSYLQDYTSHPADFRTPAISQW